MNASGRQLPPPVLLRAEEGCSAGKPWESAVIIPARNESKRIEACLHAMADSVARSGRNVGVIVIVNDTTDDTVSKAITVLRARSLPHLALDLRFSPGSGGVGRVRDLGMKLSQRIPHPPGLLMTTDADSRVDPAWVAANLTELMGAQVVFGTVIPDPDELAQLRPLLPRHFLAEQKYAQAAIRLVNHLDPLSHDPVPRHRNHAGASIALTVQAFARLGGIPWQPVSEDRALALRAEALDLRIRHATAPQVITSCRLDGRAEGGMATTLRARCSQEDPFCDDWLEAAESLARRYHAKGRLRSLWPAPSSIWSVVHQLLGPVAGRWRGTRPDEFGTFGSFWQHLEATHPALARQPLRQSDAERELPLLLARLGRTSGAASGNHAGSRSRDMCHAHSAQ